MEGDFRFSLPVYLNHRFLSTPSGWRATKDLIRAKLEQIISIHALRVEGDHHTIIPHALRDISIHALRVEGDGAL